MAENQGVDGDRWNDEATRLLLKLKWESLGDSNMDIPNDGNGVHGVDRLFYYQDSRRSDIKEGVIVEAKHYKTTSFTLASLEQWIKTIDNKLTGIKNSEKFLEKFPQMNNIPLRTGAIMIWFHDTTEYIKFKEKFWTIVNKVRTSRNRRGLNKIYLLENDKILKLASVVNSINEINSKRTIKREVNFFYPSIEGSSARRSLTLNLNYMFSKFILADFEDSDGIENKIVFFFGKLDMKSFQRLKNALSMFGYLDTDKPLTIYTYNRDSEFREIKNDVINIFKEVKFSLQDMDNGINLPTFMLS